MPSAGTVNKSRSTQKSKRCEIEVDKPDHCEQTEVFFCFFLTFDSDASDSGQSHPAESQLV